MALNHMPIYEGDNDLEKHWFAYGNYWTTNGINDEDKKMEQTTATIRKHDLTWFMNLTEKQNKTKDEIKTSFLTLFKA